MAKDRIESRPTRAVGLEPEVVPGARPSARSRSTPALGLRRALSRTYPIANDNLRARKSNWPAIRRSTGRVFYWTFLVAGIERGLGALTTKNSSVSLPSLRMSILVLNGMATMLPVG